MIAESLGLPHDDREFEIDFAPAVKDYRKNGVVIEKGTMAGLVLKASTTNLGESVATIEVRFLLDDEYVSEAFLADRPKAGWVEVDVRGTPGSRIHHELVMDQVLDGTWSTGTRAINAIPFVVDAAPGLLSPLDLPLARRIDLG